jgi:AmiR/NasT family two-component response regulator
MFDFDICPGPRQGASRGATTYLRNRWGRAMSMDQKQMRVSSGAVERRQVVAQATGVLVAQFGGDPDAAFDNLARVALEQSRAIYDVAAEIVKHDGM